MIKLKNLEFGSLPPNWKNEKILNICDIFSGGTPSTKISEYWNGNTPWLSSGETRNNFILETEKKITQLGVKNSSTRLAKKQDIVIASAGQGNTRGQVSLCLIDTYVNQSVLVLRANKEKIIPEFLFYNLKSRYDELRRISDSYSSRGSLPKSLLVILEIPLPPLLIQQKIASNLFALDSLIQNLQKQNKILEQIIQSIFKSWFIDFEFLNEDGKSYKSFGGEIVYNEEYGKEIPKGWEVSNIDKEFNLVMGQSPPGKSYNQIGDGIAFFQGRTDFGHRFPSVRMFCSEPSRFAKKGDTLISVRAPVGDVNLALYDCCIGRGLSAIRHKSDSLSYTYYIMLNLKPIFDNFESEGTVFGSINKTSFEQIKILAPAKNIVSLFEKIVNPIDKKIEDNAQQIQTLSKIRDFLLPKLMSGDIRV